MLMAITIFMVLVIGLLLIAPPRTVSSPAAIAAAITWFNRRVRVVAALAKILRFNVADVQKAVAADAEIGERRLDARLDVYHLAFVNVADVVVGTAALDVKLLQGPVFDDRNAAFFRLRHV